MYCPCWCGAVLLPVGLVHVAVEHTLAVCPGVFVFALLDEVAGL